MQSKFKEHIAQNAFFSPEDKVLLAISGGVDSVVLFHLLVAAKIHFGCAHVNFQLRGDASDGDATFVKKLCESHQIACHVHTKDTHAYAQKMKKGIQESAREIRYQWFDTLMQEKHYSKLVTAHHADDQVETFFINLIRGTGLKGLTGIPENNGRLIRPILFATKVEIEAYAQQNGIAYRQDASNADSKYLRNNLRNNILPLIEKTSANFHDIMQKNMQRLQSAQDFVEEEIKKIKEAYVIESGNSSEKSNTNIAIAKAVVYEKNAPFILYEMIKEYGFNFQQVEGLTQEIQVGKGIVSSTHRLTVDRELFSIVPLQDSPSIPQEYTIHEAGDTDHLPFAMDVKQFDRKNYRLRKDPNFALLDRHQITFPLTIRPWKDGDKFQPLGMRGQKLISDFLTQEKTDASTKRNRYVLLSKNEIVWVVGMRISEKYKITDDTTQILQLRLIKK